LLACRPTTARSPWHACHRLVTLGVARGFAFSKIFPCRADLNSIRALKANSHRHDIDDKAVAPACRPPQRRSPGRQLRLAARPPTRSEVVRHAKCKHAVDCCIRIILNFFTKRHATKVIYRLTVQTLPDGLGSPFTWAYGNRSGRPGGCRTNNLTNENFYINIIATFLNAK